MSILLVHPTDSPTDPRWAQQGWDMVFDLGWAGSKRYEEWSEYLHCPVRSVWQLFGPLESYRQSAAPFRHVQGRLVDRDGIDWADVLAPLTAEVRLTYMFATGVLELLDPVADVWTTSPHPIAETIGRLRPALTVTTFGATRYPSAFKRYRRAVRRLPLRALREVAVNKIDPDFQWRRRLHLRSVVRVDEPLILIPSAYSNVSRMASELAAAVPERRFLLVALQPNALNTPVPPNVTRSSIARYAPAARVIAAEHRILAEQMDMLTSAIEDSAPAATATVTGAIVDAMRLHLRTGLVLKAAWKKMFEFHDVDGVLCGDENHPWSRLCVLLAAQHGSRTISFHHGALDCSLLAARRGRYLADAFLVKSFMERDYLVDVCGAEASNLVLGPEIPSPSNHGCRDRGAIIFFSEPYELTNGRVEMVYQELLAPLARLAEEHGVALVVKLHPFEAKKDRARIISRVLGPEALNHVKMVYGATTDELWAQAWFGVTVESSVALECAQRGIPCFVCSWLVKSGADYDRYYARYGAAQLLSDPEELAQIPGKLGRLRDTGTATPKRMRFDVAFRCILEGKASGNHDVDPRGGRRRGDSR